MSQTEDVWREDAGLCSPAWSKMLSDLIQLSWVRVLRLAKMGPGL
jgi:hypothetical protein